MKQTKVDKLDETSIGAAGRVYERLMGTSIMHPEYITVSGILQSDYTRRVIVPVILSGRHSADPIEEGARAYEKHIGPVRGFPATLQAKELKRRTFLRGTLVPAMILAAEHPTTENIS